MCSNTGFNFSFFEHRRSSFNNSQFGDIFGDFLSSNGFHCESCTSAKCHFCGREVNLSECASIDKEHLHDISCKYLRGSDDHTDPKSCDIPPDKVVTCDLSDHSYNLVVGTSGTGARLGDEIEMERSMLIEEEDEDEYFPPGMKKTLPAGCTSRCSITQNGTNRHPYHISLQSRGVVPDRCTPGFNSEVTPDVTIKVAPGVKISACREPDTVSPAYGPNDLLEVTVGSTSKLKIQFTRQVDPDVEVYSEAQRRITKQAMKHGVTVQNSPDQDLEETNTPGRRAPVEGNDGRGGTRLNKDTARVPGRHAINPDLSELLGRQEVYTRHPPTRRPDNFRPAVVSRMVDNGRGVVDQETGEVYLSGNIITWQPEGEITTRDQTAHPAVHLIPLENRVGVTPCDPFGTSQMAP